MDLGTVDQYKNVNEYNQGPGLHKRRGFIVCHVILTKSSCDFDVYVMLRGQT